MLYYIYYFLNWIRNVCSRVEGLLYKELENKELENKELENKVGDEIIPKDYIRIEKKGSKVDQEKTNLVEKRGNGNGIGKIRRKRRTYRSQTHPYRRTKSKKTKGTTSSSI